MKRLLALLVLLGAWLGIASAEPEYDQVWVICQPDSHVIIRSSPRKKGMQLAIGEPGDFYRTDGKTRFGYLHVYGSFEAGEGWICKRYLTYEEPEIYKDGKICTVNVKKVNCRRCIGGKRKGWLKQGAEVNVLVETSEWCVTNYGYIQTKYLEAVDEKDG